MALILIGGQAKNIGKTTLVCNVIRTFAQLHWTAVKCTTHQHAVQGCDSIAEGPDWAVLEQKTASNASDTGRFLLAGAKRAFLVQASAEELPQAWTKLRNQVASNTNVIVESTSAAEFAKPELFLLVVDLEIPGVKASASKQIKRADALVSTHAELPAPATGKPIFLLRPEELDDLLESFIRARLGLDDNTLS